MQKNELKINHDLIHATPKANKQIMVKNTHGGSGHKKFARKDMHASAQSHRLRVAEVQGEMYAIVVKMCGNGMVHVHCIDNVLRLGHIRGKFTGRRKKDNFVSIGTWVMVGLRDGDDGLATATAATTTNTSKKAKLRQCDLLEVYSNAEKEQLRKTVISVDWRILTANDVSTTVAIDEKEHNGEGVCFTNQDDDDGDDDDLMPKKTNKTSSINNNAAFIADEEATEFAKMIDIDDI